MWFFLDVVYIMHCVYSLFIKHQQNFILSHPTCPTQFLRSCPSLAE